MQQKNDIGQNRCQVQESCVHMCATSAFEKRSPMVDDRYIYLIEQVVDNNNVVSWYSVRNT